MRRLIFFCLLVLSWTGSIAQVNVALLHQLVDNNKSEHSRQTAIRDKQSILTAGEQVNRAEGSRLKQTYRNIQKRFSAVGMTIQAVQIGLEAIPLTKRIASDQQRLIYLCRDNPALIALSLEAQVDMVERSELLLRYLYGLSLSIGDLDAMSRSDRSILGRFVVSELREISLNLSGLIRTLISSKTKFNPQGSIFSSTLAKDAALAARILSKFRQLK